MPIMLTPEQERRITAYAAHRKEPIERVIDDLITVLPVISEDEDRTLELLDAWAEEDATDDEEELLRRDNALAEFKANMNANRAATGEEPIYR